MPLILLPTENAATNGPLVAVRGKCTTCRSISEQYIRSERSAQPSQPEVPRTGKPHIFHLLSPTLHEHNKLLFRWKSRSFPAVYVIALSNAD